MSNSEFEKAADREFSLIFDSLDGEEAFDLDLERGILTIEAEEGGTFLLNKNAHHREIWLSSPLSGAWHFRQTGEEWVSTKSPSRHLSELLSSELSQLAGRDIKLK